MRCVAILLLALALVSLARAHSEPVALMLERAFQQRQSSNYIVKHRSVADESKYFADVKFLTSSGTNAEAYWSFDGKQFSMQAIRGKLGQAHPCDQIYTMAADGSNINLVSGGQGRTTCAYFYPDGRRVLYGSTRSGGKYCPPNPDMRYGYLWPLNKEMEIYVQDLETGNLSVLFSSPAYDAEATFAPNGKRIIFTSAKDGDLELYTMRPDGSDVRRMTYTPGYDGGAWFSWDSSKIVWRANRPRGANLTEYFSLLEFGLTAPADMQIYWQDAELLNPPVQLTRNGGTNFSPVFTPDSQAVIFSSDMHAPNSGNFQLFMVNLDGSGLQQITTEGSFNAFAMFSPDGKTLAWESDRNTTHYGLINVLTATWKGPHGR